jgi:diguanylate cyclase (GGDEF)-like protein/PAS domain S-box-containing protein
MNNFDRQKLPESEVLGKLQGEVLRLHKVVDALIERAERPGNIPNSAFGLFQATVLLEDQVRSRTTELESALRGNEAISRELQFAKEKIEASERILRNIVEFAPIGMSITDATHRYTLVNQAFCQIVGYKKEELYELTPLDITHPEDMPVSIENLEKLWESRKDSYQIEKRYVHKSGHSVWVRLTVSTSFDSEGSPSIYIGQVEDITKRRQSEEQLRLASKVFNFSNEAMMITDNQNNIIAINPAFTKLTGYASDDVLNKNPKVLSSGRHDAKFYKELWHKLTAEHHWEGEMWNRKKSGEIFTEWLSIASVLDDKGDVQNYVALFSDITEEKKASEKIWEHANYDALTKLPNRRLFYDRLGQLVRSSDRTNNPLALMFIDLDHFKEVNDTLGHQVGDELLIQVANRITSKVRVSDTVARMGGDEFTAIFPEVASRSDMVKMANELNSVLAKPFLIGGNHVQISASIGVILYPQDAIDINDLLNGADKAMYLSKQQGRNRFNFFESNVE